MIVCARSGSGKTMATNLWLGRIMPMGATGGVIDRAGHYETLAKLVPGAIAVNLGTNPGFDENRQRLDPWTMPAEDRPAAVNPWDVEDPRELPTEKLQYLLALHSFFLGTQTPGRHLRPHPHRRVAALARDPRGVHPLRDQRRDPA